MPLGLNGYRKKGQAFGLCSIGGFDSCTTSRESCQGNIQNSVFLAWGKSLPWKHNPKTGLIGLRWCCITCGVQESKSWGLSAAGLGGPWFLAEYKYNALWGKLTQLGPSGFWQSKMSQILAISSPENQQSTIAGWVSRNSVIRRPRTSDIGISKNRI